MTTLLVTYPAQDGARFDADYYVNRHLPLVRESWERYGLVDARALLPEPGQGTAYHAVALLRFADGAALDRALASAEAAAVFADVAVFTDIGPVAQRCVDG